MSNSNFSSFFSLISLAIISSLPLISSQSCNKADMATLLSIKNSFGNPSELASWDASRAADCCSSWRGVGCGTNGRITSIGIFSANVSGPIPSSVADLSALTIINFFNVPNLVGTIPSSITKLTSLTQLTIGNAALSGNVPPFLCDMPGLSYLDLSGNRLTGSIPSCLMTRVKSINSPPLLRLSQNLLTRKIPASFANIDFGTIDLSHNQLTGDASFLFGGRSRSSIDTINLSWNGFEFDLSPVKFPVSLAQLDLSHNKIRGSIPQQITKLKKLTFLDVSYNLLCGPIPKMKAFSQLPTAFEQNMCLCGAPLAPCGRSLLMMQDQDQNIFFGIDFRYKTRTVLLCEGSLVTIKQAQPQHLQLVSVPCYGHGNKLEKRKKPHKTSTKLSFCFNSNH